MTDTVSIKPVVRVQAGSSSAHVADGLMNVISGAGTGADKSQHARYTQTYLDPYQVESSYRTSGLSRKIHDIVPYEETREWRNWQADEGDTEKLEALERRLNIRDAVRDARVAARLYGGAVLVLGLDGRVEQPARKGAKLKYVLALSRHQIGVGPINKDLNSENFGRPDHYTLNNEVIHPSRVIPIHGQRLPLGTNDTSFWGDPLLMSLEMQLKNADSAQQNIAALVNEAKISTLTVPGLTNNLATAEYESLLARRMAINALFQSTFAVRMVDGAIGTGAEGEKWETWQPSFAGLPDVQRSFNVMLSAVSDIPYTRLFGESAGGLNSSGKNEQRDFERMIRSRQNVEMKPVLDRLDEYLIPTALGSIPGDVHWRFAPLSTMDEVEASDVDKKNAETIKTYVDAGVMPTEVAAEVVKNRLIESGRWAGVEKAYEDSDAALEVEEIEAEVIGDADLNDAAPRSLYVQRKLTNTAEFIAWAKSQGFDSVTDPDQIHVTVLYSRAAVDWMKMGETWDGNEKGELTVKPGGARIVEPLGDMGAVVLLFNSSELSWRHRNMVDAGASHDYDDYQPHVTITYKGEGIDLSKVEPYRGKLVFGPEIFEELTDGWRPSES